MNSSLLAMHNVETKILKKCLVPFKVKLEFVYGTRSSAEGNGRTIVRSPLTFDGVGSPLQVQSNVWPSHSTKLIPESTRRGARAAIAIASTSARRWVGASLSRKDNKTLSGIIRTGAPAVVV
jgi:hypothetical protein